MRHMGHLNGAMFKSIAINMELKTIDNGDYYTVKRPGWFRLNKDTVTVYLNRSNVIMQDSGIFKPMYDVGCIQA